MRVFAAVHDISQIESMIPALDGVLLDRVCISHKKKEIRRPLLHLLFGGPPESRPQFATKVKEATEDVLTAEKGVMLRVHSTQEFLYEYRRRLSTLYPVYLTIDVKGLCPSVLRPGRLQLAFARLRRPRKGYGEYPKGPGWE